MVIVGFVRSASKYVRGLSQNAFGILQLQYAINTMYKNLYRLTEAYSEYLEEEPCSDSAETICAKFDQVSLTRNMDESVEALRKVCK